LGALARARQPLLGLVANDPAHAVELEVAPHGLDRVLHRGAASAQADRALAVAKRERERLAVGEALLGQRAQQRDPLQAEQEDAPRPGLLRQQARERREAQLVAALLEGLDPGRPGREGARAVERD